MRLKIFSRGISIFFLSIVINAALLSVSRPARADEPLRIGGIYGLTGLLPDLGNQFSKGANAYLALAGKAGGRITLVEEDSGWDTKRAVLAYHKLADTGGVKVVHVMGSGPSLAIKPLTEAAGIILFSAAAHPDLTPGSSYVLRHSNLASEDALSLAAYLKTRVREAEPIATIYLQNEWGQSYDTALREALLAEHPELHIRSEPHLPADTEFSSILSKLLHPKPQMLVVNSTGNAVPLVIAQARKLGFTGPIYANNGLALSVDAQLRLRGTKYGEVYYQKYPAPPAAFNELFPAEVRANGGPGYFALIAFTDLELLDSVTREVGPSPAAIMQRIKSIGTFKGRFASLSISSAGDILVPTTVERF